MGRGLSHTALAQIFALGRKGKAAWSAIWPGPAGVGHCARRGHLSSSEPTWYFLPSSHVQPAALGHSQPWTCLSIKFYLHMGHCDIICLRPTLSIT